MSAIRMQERTPVAVRVMGVREKRRVLLTEKGRLAFPDLTMDEMLAEGAYAAMGGSTSRAYTVLKEWRHICANGNVSRALPKPLFYAAMDGFAIKVLRAITRAMAAGHPYTAVERHERRYLSEHCRRALRHCFDACCYPNYVRDTEMMYWLSRDNFDRAKNVPASCCPIVSCRPLFAMKKTGIGIVAERATYANSQTGRFLVTIDWAWYRDLYLRGLAVVERHLVLRYLETVSSTLHRVTVLVQQKGVNRFTEEERLIWQTGEGMLLLRP